MSKKCGRVGGSQPVVGWWGVHFGGSQLWALREEDLPWLYEDLKSKSVHDNRRIALSAIAHLRRPELKAHASALRKLIGKDPALRKELNFYLRPPPLSPERRGMNQDSANARKSARPAGQGRRIMA